MNKEQYQVYLQSDHWKSLRRAKLEQAGYRCQTCGSCYCLQVHHLKYRNIYDVTLQDLKVVCRYCHEKEHGIDSGFRPIKPDVSELLKHELNVPKRFPMLPTSIVKRMTPEEAKAQIAKNKQKKHERKALWAYDKAWKRSDELSGR